MPRFIQIGFGLTIVLMGLIGCGHEQSPSTETAPEANRTDDQEKIQPQIRAFCGDCHAFPPPDSFPRDAWFAEVEQGYRFYLESGRSDLHPPPMRDVVAFFRAKAPVKLTMPSFPTTAVDESMFRQRTLAEFDTAPAISYLGLIPPSDRGTICLCDMHSGQILRVNSMADPPSIQELARIAHPAHVTICDLNQNGQYDLLIAELGSFVPGDHAQGKVYWIEGGAEAKGTPLETHVLFGDLGRVADVQPADFDLDGDIDLIIAEFGWRKTGSIRLLEQLPPAGDIPAFREHLLDRRHGAIHVPIADLNGDGLPDFVALISQEHEVVDAFLNRGDWKFERERIFTAPDPAFGSSGIELVDMDRDGDLDVLYTNGDTLDSHYLKPTHGIHWLENCGEFPFTPRRIAALPGAMRAVSADIDGDNDLDVIAVAFLPATLRQQFVDAKAETLIWLEQTGTKEFVRHTLETGDAGHMTVLAADLDQDGDVDLAVPNYAEQRTVRMHPLTIWWNTARD